MKTLTSSTRDYAYFVAPVLTAFTAFAAYGTLSVYTGLVPAIELADEANFVLPLFCIALLPALVWYAIRLIHPICWTVTISTNSILFSKSTSTGNDLLIQRPEIQAFLRPANSLPFSDRRVPLVFRMRDGKTDHVPPEYVIRFGVPQLLDLVDAVWGFGYVESPEHGECGG
ncbi:hypothetical protein Poly51_06260 [Rubripirellula tenax]|uniref:Uncharacterized protein n=1 Tax=Rubripirellula tenax TaxID=2528015 RepID=A0A5C6FFQ7_9BACT|nr:hypothetical protein [Rubripirellula tenax]TWU60351.1 hypothetical protein Poly51_06260 [Rubripirellula tenax]